MGQLIPEDTLAQIRLANDVVEVVGATVPLRRSGSSWKGLCPFHEEKTPSFNVNPQRQTYHCFGCGASGNVISFLMATEKLGFLDAVRQLADRVGIRIEPRTPRDASEESRRLLLFSTLEWATRYFEITLRSENGAEARRYLKSRGLSPETVRTYRLGFALPSWDGLLRAAREKGIATDVLLDAGLVVPSQSSERSSGNVYDRFRGRVVFPIFDLQGRPIAFGARSLDGSEPKYLNSPETALFSKGRMLYGLHAAREAAQREKRLAITEGYTDVLMAHQMGFAPVVATLGTALTREHAKLVRRFAEDVRLVYDADEGGERASERGIEIFLEEGLEVRIATLPDGLDPCDLLVRDGVEPFRAAVDQARDYVEYAIESACRRHPTSTVSGRAAAAEDLLSMIRKIDDPIRRDLVVRQVSYALGVTEAALRERLAAHVRKPAASRGDAAATPVESIARRREREIIGSLLALPERLPSVATDIAEHGLVEADLAQVLDAAIAIAQRGDVPTPDRLLLDLPTDDLRSLASSLLASEGGPGKEDRLFQGAIDALRRHQRKTRLEQLRASRIAALREGDSAAVEACLRATQNELKKG